MSDLYRGMDARAIVVKLQILSGAVVEERCFRAVEATGDASGAFVSTATACTSDAAPILPVVYRVVKLCPLSARLLAVRLQELPTTFVLSSTVTMAPASVVPLEKPEGDACRESGTPQANQGSFFETAWVCDQCEERASPALRRVRLAVRDAPPALLAALER